MNPKPEPGVAAPCGLYCDNCPEGPSSLQVCCAEDHCPSRLGHEACPIYRCCVTDRGLADCAACVDFPCATLLRFAHSGDNERLPLILNLQRRRRLGSTRWLAEEQAFWARPENARQWARLRRRLSEKRQHVDELRARILDITLEVEQASLCREVNLPTQRVSSRV